jgi:AcrR family transcriptional regulator
MLHGRGQGSQERAGLAGGKRPYRMRERLRAVERTRESILQAAFDLWLAQPYDEVTLERWRRGRG